MSNYSDVSDGLANLFLPRVFLHYATAEIPETRSQFIAGRVERFSFVLRSCRSAVAVGLPSIKNSS